MNPRRPTPADLESAPFDPLGHPRHILYRLRGLNGFMLSHYDIDRA